VKNFIYILSMASCAFSQGTRTQFPSRAPEPLVRYASAFPGADLGDQINAAYADLPSSGGAIMVTEGGFFKTPIVFGTKNKPVVLIGLPGGIVTMTYTGTSGIALTFDYGTGHRMGHGLRDLTLTGPGNSTTTTGVLFGGMNGAEGIEFRDFKIESFGTNLEMGSNTWLAYFEHGMTRDSRRTVLLPSGLVQAGEQIVFNHVTFADAPPPHTDSVWVQGNGQEVVFRDCSFDQVQLRIGNGKTSGAQVVVTGAHFENPNHEWPESVNYDFVVVDDNPANYLRMSESYFLQACPYGGPSRFMRLSGGTVYMMTIGMYTPQSSPLKNFAVLENAVNVAMDGFHDLSGNIDGPFFSGLTSGHVAAP
jgi:hypothetical protein